MDVAGEETAVGREREPPVWSGAQQCGAGDVFELPDLSGEAGGRGAELAGCVLEVWLSGDREEPADALSGAGGVGVRARPGDAGCPAGRRFPGDGLADAGLGQQRAGLPAQAQVQVLWHGEHECGVVRAALPGQLQRPGEVAGVGAGEQLDQAEPGELLLRRGVLAGAAVLRQQEVELAAPASGIQRGLAEAA